MIPSPAFFDVFGIFLFSFLIGLSIWELNTKKQTPNWIGIGILLVAILGLVVDSFNVIRGYII